MFRWMTVAFSLMLCLVLVSDRANADKKKKSTTITGVLLSIDASKDVKDTGTITVKTPEKKKKDVVVAEAKDWKLEVTKDTKIEKAAEKKKDPATPATFSDLQKDQSLTVTFLDGKAEKVLILFKKK